MQFSGRKTWISLTLALAALVTGCSMTSTTRAPVEDRTAGSSAPRVDPATLPGYENTGKPGYYTVRQGDTIMKIANEVHQPWRDVVRWNNLDNPNQIEVGQVLRVVPPTGTAVASAPVTETRAPAGSASSAPSKPAVPVATQTTPGVPPSTPSTAAAPSAGADDVDFIWPASGPLIAGFDEAKNKGLGIGGKAGDPVVAAADHILDIHSTSQDVQPFWVYPAYPRNAEAALAIGRPPVHLVMPSGLGSGTPLIQHGRHGQADGGGVAVVVECGQHFRQSAADLATFWGIETSEDDVLLSLPLSENPDKGFVGYYNGAWGNIPPSSYGVHAGPIAKALVDLGLNAKDRYGLTSDELAFYDALGANDAAVMIMGDDILKQIARDLTTTIKNNLGVDWAIRETVRAQMRLTVKKLLKKYGYPPDKQDAAVKTVMEQAELMCGNEVENETEYPQKAQHGLPLAAEGKGGY